MTFVYIQNPISSTTLQERVEFVSDQLGLQPKELHSFNPHLKKKQIVLHLPKTFEKFIDHTNLNVKLKSKEVQQLCADAIKYQFRGVCVHSTKIKQVHSLLKNTDLRICTLIGSFPESNAIEGQLIQAKIALKSGANELDIVLSTSKILNNEYNELYQHLKSFESILTEGSQLNVILETGELGTPQIIDACLISICANVKCVKAIQKFGSRGSSRKNIRLIKFLVGLNRHVQSFDQFSNPKSVWDMINNGAQRIGTNNGIELLNSNAKIKYRHNSNKNKNKELTNKKSLLSKQKQKEKKKERIKDLAYVFGLSFTTSLIIGNITKKLK
ncbi:putative aldolase [Anaeramoeba flamelloides]|uniref:Aldolase n=1 Tax=Anaeramoeba flamelloides TaxID=1746091 RepID=A0AAV7YV89_9EUKA|nr:putative aldolase [Anaeramoeba flamelloides]